MIILANVSHMEIVSQMLYAMYNELQPDKCSKNKSDYDSEALRYLKDYDVLLDSEFRGMFMVKHVNNPLTPNLEQWNGEIVYIKPQYRKTRVLKTMYTYLFNNYEGDILGLTDINSEHIKVMDKRHTCIAKLYIVNKGK